MSGREDAHCASLMGSAPELSKELTHQCHQNPSLHCNFRGYRRAPVTELADCTAPAREGLTSVAVRKV
eukprot:111559-Prymnesium_polylepis.2